MSRVCLRPVVMCLHDCADSLGRLSMVPSHACAGPTTCEAIFLNREELPCYPLYFDPVHDYGALSCFTHNPTLLLDTMKNSSHTACLAAGVCSGIPVAGHRHEC